LPISWPGRDWRSELGWEAERESGRIPGRRTARERARSGPVQSDPGWVGLDPGLPTAPRMIGAPRPSPDGGLAPGGPAQGGPPPGGLTPGDHDSGEPDSGEPDSDEPDSDEPDSGEGPVAQGASARSGWLP